MTTHDSNYTTLNMSEIYDTEEPPEEFFFVIFQINRLLSAEIPLPKGKNYMHKILKGFSLWRPEYYKTCNVHR